MGIDIDKDTVVEIDTDIERHRPRDIDIRTDIDKI